MTDFQLRPKNAAIPTSSPALGGDTITLQVGEQKFITTADTLIQGSGFFASALSGRWQNMQADGSYFVDADPKLFEHILRYLRRGIFPVFYNNAKGHDHALYLALREEARYFQIIQLEKWLETKAYLEVVTIKYSSYNSEHFDGIPQENNRETESTHHISWKTAKVYVCPRGLSRHRGDPNACRRQCHNARGDADEEYENESVYNVTAILKKTVFNGLLCIEGRE
ncbi:hypothetical protein MMC19_002745 [Ptychographa xylographoides]|nr:hypothetical protein [Ptychographa xylographoides]